MSEQQQKLVLSIIDFLNQSIQDGTVKQDDKEGLDVASTLTALLPPFRDPYSCQSSASARRSR